MNTDFHADALYYGDCLEIISGWPDECVDLIYLDPPFNSGRNYNLIFDRKSDLFRKTTAQARAFDDTWYWDEEASARIDRLKSVGAIPINTITGLELIHDRSEELSYLGYMAERLAQLHRVLKPTGSIYLHCDPTMSHSLKLLMDGLFGKKNFRREIVWKMPRPSGFKTQAENWIRGHDTIFYYVKSKDFVFNKLYEPYEEEYLRHFNQEDEKGRYWLRDGRKRYLGEGYNISSNWIDIDSMQTQSISRKEGTGYATQKPLALLDRIINASSNPGDIVLDPFCGCGTACVSATGLKRKFIGIDISSFAVEQVIAKRLQEGSHSKESIKLLGVPTDFETCRRLAKNADRKWRLKFERWAVNKIPGMVPNIKQTGDGGIDGEGRLVGKPQTKAGKKLSPRVLAQVKSGGVSADSIRAFSNVIQSQNACAGVFITLESFDSPTMRETQNALGSFTMEGSANEYPRLQSWSMREWFDAKRKQFPRKHFPNLPPMADFYTGKPIDLELWD